MNTFHVKQHFLKTPLSRHVPRSKNVKQFPFMIATEQSRPGLSHEPCADNINPFLP